MNLLAARCVLLIMLASPLFPLVEGHGGPVRESILVDHHVAEAPRALAKTLQPPEWMPSTADADFGLRFKCPNEVRTNSEGISYVNEQACPSLILDRLDLMSQPVLLVNGKSPFRMAFHALHGGHGIYLPTDASPPTERSRINSLHQPHTVFTTVNEGAEWTDLPYFAPDVLRASGRTVWGEDNAAVLDGDGRVHIASLYSYKDSPSSPAKYVVATWQLGRIGDPMGYANFELLRPQGNNSIESIHMVYDDTSERIVLTWLETRTSPTAGRLSSWIEVRILDPEAWPQWQELPDIQRIGGCVSITNPVAFQGTLFIGCLPGEDYPASGNTSADLFQIHSIHLDTRTSRHESSTPIDTHSAVLVDRGGTGYHILIGSDVKPGAGAVTMVSFGILGRQWSNAADFSKEFKDTRTNSQDSVRAVDARVTAAAVTKDTGNLHVIYQEQYAQESTDPSTAAESVLHKSYVVMRLPGLARAQFLGHFDLKFGDATTRTNFGPALQGGVSQGVFHDLHDSLVVVRDPRNGNERVFIAYGDYGYVRFAEVVEENPFPPFVLPGLQAPAAPLAASAPNATGSTAAAAAIFGLMLVRLLTARRKMKVAAPTQ